MVLALSFLICKMGVNHTYPLLRPRRPGGVITIKRSAWGWAHIKSSVSHCFMQMNEASRKSSTASAPTATSAQSCRPRVAARNGRAPECRAQSPAGPRGAASSRRGSDLWYQPQSMAGGEEEGHRQGWRHVCFVGSGTLKLCHLGKNYYMVCWVSLQPSSGPPHPEEVAPPQPSPARTRGAARHFPLGEHFHFLCYVDSLLGICFS